MTNWSRILPKNATDTFAFIFTLFGINVIFCFELFVMLPRTLTLYEDYSSLKYYFHMFMGLYIYFNALSSFWKTIVTDASVRGLLLPSILKPGWRFCPVCECNAPSRSFHCHTCKICVLRRDHHCVFTGNCVGHSNHRYYLTLVFFAALAAFYASVFNMDVAWDIMNTTWFPFSILRLIFPFFAWVMGLTTFTDMLQAAMVLFCMATMCGVSALLFYHLRNLYHGQITHESSHKIIKYDLGWKENVRLVMGERWHIAWLSPWIPSPLPGDGLEFTTRDKFENTKDI
ncbi:protein-cysteine S-acyltransferase [Mactra antiquata]